LDLEKSQARVNLAARAANLGLWEWDLVRNEIWANEVSRARLGADATDRIDLELMIEHVHPDDREKSRQTISQAIESGRHLSLEYRFILPDGSERWIALSGEVVLGPNLKPTLMRGVSIDITDLKLAELDMQVHRSALMHVQRTTTVSQLSRALTHELNQPLGAILRNAEAGEAYLNKTPPDLSELQHIIEDICKDAKRAAVVIDSLRSLLKRDSLNLESLQLSELIRQTISLLNSEIQTREAQLHLDIPVELSNVHGDRVHLQQVLLNLLLNSLDALSGQPQDRRKIDIRAMETENDMVAISVADRGEGIKPNVLSQLFVPFCSTKKDGLGLGLSISKTIVEYHHGQIFAENNPDGGATVTFTLQKSRTGEV
jgi:PAS domain S-box-containing protein